jgi:CNT family concentrative nucleoside transporter
MAKKVEDRYPRNKTQAEEDEPIEEAPKETVGGEPIERVSPMDAAIIGALDGVKMAVSIAAVLILILGFVSLINQIFAGLAGLPAPIGKVVTLQNILGFLFVPVTFLTGVSLDPNEIWKSSVIIGRRLFETAIPPYQELGRAAAAGELSDRAVLIISYALSGFAHIASVGIFVGGTIALAPSRRKDISQLGWKALFIGTLATLMIACVAGLYDNGNPSILGDKPLHAPVTSPSPAPSLSPSPTATTTPSSTAPANPSPTTVPAVPASPKGSPSSNATSATPKPSPAVRVSPRNTPSQSPAQTPKPTPTRSSAT